MTSTAPRHTLGAKDHPSSLLRAAPPAQLRMGSYRRRRDLVPRPRGCSPIVRRTQLPERSQARWARRERMLKRLRSRPTRHRHPRSRSRPPKPCPRKRSPPLLSTPDKRWALRPALDLAENARCRTCCTCPTRRHPRSRRPCPHAESRPRARRLTQWSTAT